MIEVGKVVNSQLNYVNKNYTSYSYDNLNRLESENYTAFTDGSPSTMWSESYTFDDNNNALTKTHDDIFNDSNDTVTTSTYDDCNKITSQVKRNYNNVIVNDYDFIYDYAGNLITKQNNNITEITYDYDAMNRTSAVIKGVAVTLFKYDAKDERIRKATGSKVTSSIWNRGSISCDVIVNGTSTTVNEYSAGNWMFITNGVSTLNATDSTGDIVFSVASNNINKYEFDAYGNKIEGEPSANPFSYKNYYYDSETGLYYLNARYYDPTTEQFTQEDTVQDDNLQYNFYGYCSANPVLYKDTTGHWKIVGFGVQAEVSLTFGSVGGEGGVEIVWLLDSQVKVGQHSRAVPYVYFYVGGSLCDFSSKASSTLNGIINNLAKSPQKLLGKPSFSGSLCLFAVFGNSGFDSPSDYNGLSYSCSGTAFHAKSYISSGGSCWVVGVGADTTFIGGSMGKCKYWGPIGYNASAFSNLENSVKDKTKKMKKK